MEGSACARGDRGGIPVSTLYCQRKEHRGMTDATFVVQTGNLVYMGLLPVIFFRHDGQLNWRWWLTASPYFVSALLLALCYAQVTPPWYLRDSGILEVPAVILSLLSISLISYTLGTHRRRLALWHQTNDAPEEIVTYGAYRYIRHPFYSAFALTLIGVSLTTRTPLSIGVAVYGLGMLVYTAVREERRLLASPLAATYRKYRERTGRFLPRCFGRRTQALP
jgi:protein-S-isoprenylcysteine O-methyltransferase Ste14